jgi:myosin-crossreactive antigen
MPGARFAAASAVNNSCPLVAAAAILIRDGDIPGYNITILEDVVFTVECSIRAAQTATSSLPGLSLKPPPVYKGCYDPRVLLKIFLTFHNPHAHA